MFALYRAFPDELVFLSSYRCEDKAEEQGQYFKDITNGVYVIVWYGVFPQKVRMI
jgi:hypothetical protein